MSNPKKVMIAEDSSVIQNLTRKILSIQNYEITSVKNGQQVLDTLKTENFDIILMDINMPVMDGIECTQKIRSLDDPHKSNVPIVAITGNARNLSASEYNDIGINELLQKPLNFDELVTIVKKYTTD
ncbi:MAG: response regulator [Cyclobacteriaceae bacterium]|nr:response regulator [Cyclobacteriaceae bacterium]